MIRILFLVSVFSLTACSLKQKQQTKESDTSQVFEKLYQNSKDRRPASAGLERLKKELLVQKSSVRTYGPDGKVALYFSSADEIMIKICESYSIIEKGLNCPESEETQTVRIPIKVFETSLRAHFLATYMDFRGDKPHEDDLKKYEFGKKYGWDAAGLDLADRSRIESVLKYSNGLNSFIELVLKKVRSDSIRDIAWSKSMDPAEKIFFNILESMTLAPSKNRSNTLSWTATVKPKERPRSLLKKLFSSEPKTSAFEKVNLSITYLEFGEFEPKNSLFQFEHVTKICELIYVGFSCKWTRDESYRQSYEGVVPSLKVTPLWMSHPTDEDSVVVYLDMMAQHFLQLLNIMDPEHSYRNISLMEEAFIAYSDPQDFRYLLSRKDLMDFGHEVSMGSLFSRVVAFPKGKIVSREDTLQKIQKIMKNYK